jgi:ADP-ribosylglycohydrolase/protein-tyrosine phosphatase
VSTVHPRPIPNCYWVLPGKFLAGEYPRDLDRDSSDRKLRALIDGGVTCFVDLTGPDDRLEPYAELVEQQADVAVTLEHFPVRDLSVPSSPDDTVQILDAIDSEIERGGIVYLHCWGGVGRTGTIVGCWLVRQGYSGSDALKRLRELWSQCPKSQTRQSPETHEQESYIINWQEHDDPGAGLRTWRALGGQYRSQFRGTMLGLAVGDALGAPVEFLPREEILRRYGPDGLAELRDWGGFPAGHYTDDTQMSLATAIGVIRTRQRFIDRGLTSLCDVVYQRYLAWRQTQYDPHESRAPGATCLSALDSGRIGTIGQPINDSKGCGGVMRTAPVGLALNVEDQFAFGAECAAITHGHPSGYLTAGYLSELVARLVRGCGLKSAVRATRHSLVNYEGHEETLRFVDRALEMADLDIPTDKAIAQLGQGWVGEEALAIALFCALRYPDDWKAAVLAAVNHSGDSDSTGSICGAILGASLGVESIPSLWIEQIENRDLLVKMADDMHTAFVEDKTLSFREYPPN